MTTHITQTTHCFTLQQLRAATQAGGVAGVSLKGHGHGFFIQIQLRTGQQAVLVTARSRSPRMFKNPVQAFGVLRRVGIVTGSFDVTHFSPEQQQTDSDKAAKKVAKKEPVKTATKVGRAKKVATLAPIENPVVAAEPSALDKAKEQVADATQSSLSDPTIQIDEAETKRLLEEQKNNQVGVQQSLI
ncbi:hypothetical protein [Paenalcaligenes faecalis]|uniref:hypothetical protein n=1 Tax=Paenalcaligenes faecalis TaxID=2980099 RepID=UPI0022B96FDA|nr:hypothetical protein [Paenalcaligenes faecalis]